MGSSGSHLSRANGLRWNVLLDAHNSPGFLAIFQTAVSLTGSYQFTHSIANGRSQQ